MEIVDPYEQYLLDVFESCDDFNQGSLSAAGLQELCEKLQLQDRCVKLTKCLLGDLKSKRVLFQEFRDELLKILDGMDCDENTDRELSSAREPSKCTFEQKKDLGRHSVSNVYDENLSGASYDEDESQILNCSTGDLISDEFVSKKRRRGGSKRKKIIAKVDSSAEIQMTSSVSSTSNEVDHLITAWSNISRGVTDSLSSDELVRVFQSVGLERGSEEAAQCVFEKLGVDENGRITLRDLLEFIGSGESWSKGTNNQSMDLETIQKNVSMDFVELPTLGSISGGSLVEQWECAGVPGALQLLHNLGFSLTQQIDLASLVTQLSDEIKGLEDEMKTTRRNMDPQLALLRANSVLQIMCIQSLKTMVEHVNAEKEKLRNDVIEANQRASLLAQEVDDHHSKLEHSTQQQVKILEQKHVEKIREVTNQAKMEQDALLAQNMMLEKKLKLLEDEDVKNKAVITQLELESKLIEQEHRAVVDQLAAVQLIKDKLEKDLHNISTLNQEVRVAEIEAPLNENDVVSLLERIQTLETENTHLRDRNDELCVEVEELSAKLLNISVKKRSNTSLEECFGGGSGGGTKRRGDSFTLIDSEEDSGGEEGSPRLGKVRKCSHMNTTSLQGCQIHEGSSGDYTESNPTPGEPVFTEHKNVAECTDVNSFKIVPFSEELEQARVENSGNTHFCQDFEGNDAVKTFLRTAVKRLSEYDAELGKEITTAFKEFTEEKAGLRRVIESLENRCKELETSLELLKVEYEKTEDYWSEKLEEERAYYEAEQKQSDKKYDELLGKVLEYEEMVNSEDRMRQRLETIEEKDNFEKQVADMEQECAELRYKLKETVLVKESEIEHLKSQLAGLRHSRDCADSGIQVSDTSSLECSDNQNIIGKHSIRKSHNFAQGTHSACKQCADIKSLLETKVLYEKEVERLREEWEKLCKEINEKKENLNNYSGVGGRLYNHNLEQRCRTLMTTLRQQQKQTEDILRNTWKQHQAEVNDLKSVIKMTEDKLKRQTKVIQEQLNKLSKTDLLVKDLFVENAYLISSVQKLEQQRQSGNSPQN